MTTNSFLGRGRMRAVARLLSGALLFAAGCFAGDSGKGPSSSSGSHWLACSEDGDCAKHGTGATCDGGGFCIDKAGKRITVSSGGTAGTSGGGSGTSGSAGTSGTAGASGTGDCSGAIPEICKVCKDGSCGKPVCKNGSYVFVCPEDGAGGAGGAGGTGGTGGGSADAGMGTALPNCQSMGIGDGAMCTGPADQAAPACCLPAGVELQCSFEACTNSIPGSCTGTYKPVVGSTACSYQPCGGKSCGDSCNQCDPSDKTCVETSDVKVCTGAGGDCIAGAVDCGPTGDCDPFGANTCGKGMVCCDKYRCGPSSSGMGQCEVADAAGGCEPCACEMDPMGCPVCNSPETPILTPTGERAIVELREGDLVMSMDHGVLVAVPILRTGQMPVHNHAVVRLLFDNGEQVEISGSHPTADGGRLDALVPGDTLGDVHVLSAEMVPYTHDRTYDILPASDTGTYVAGGALIGSTMKVPGVE